eukprot:TRINITY_DN5005_c0_g1_i1.p1 TRINITY_DN5005_c0_g1~~TRINITY_DN5005_c0_g1_i1.p1  ORF type:complete len:205 (-),score=25.72 TRINITY_DN5005_c0_g1_i1:536-1150(-)
MSSRHVHSATCGCKKESELGDMSNLYADIDRDKVYCLNEKVQDSGKSIIKPWDERLDMKTVVKSNDDPQLIIYIPFTSCVKLKAFNLITGGDTRPTKVKLFINKEGITFQDVDDLKCVQEITIVDDTKAEADYVTKITKFSSVDNLTMYFPEAEGGKELNLFYLGLKGEASKAKRQAVAVTYESVPNIKDHKTKGDQNVLKELD